jgi:hypothetical protein
MSKAILMKMTVTTVGAVLAISWCLARAQESSPERDVAAANAQRSFNFWMGHKLEESQAILAALALSDFPAIVKSTDGLKGLTKIEAFVRRRSPEYRTQLRSFEFAVEEMNKQAKAENIEAVVLGFHQMTLSCVHCHKQLRNQVVGKTDQP